MGCHPFAINKKGAAMRIVGVTGGVDTHADVHVAAAVDDNGGLLGFESFPATKLDMRVCWPGCQSMVRWSGLGLRALARGESDCPGF